MPILKNSGRKELEALKRRSINNISNRAHPNCVVCSSTNLKGLQLEFAPGADGNIEATFTCDKTLEGYPGVVHGGIVSAHVTRFSHPLCLLEAEIVQDGKVKATAKGKFYDRTNRSTLNGVSYAVCQR